MVIIFLKMLVRKVIYSILNLFDLHKEKIPNLILQKFKKYPHLSRKDKIKFFTFVGDEIISYSYLILFDKPTKKHNCILGIVITDQWQGKGYGKKICNYMIKTAWKKNLKKIWLSVFSDNIPAQKIYRNLGFELEGIFLDDEIFDGKKRNVLSMAILKERKSSKISREKIWQEFY